MMTFYLHNQKEVFNTKKN